MKILLDTMGLKTHVQTCLKGFKRSRGSESNVCQHPVPLNVSLKTLGQMCHRPLNSNVGLMILGPLKEPQEGSQDRLNGSEQGLEGSK